MNLFLGTIKCQRCLKDVTLNDVTFSDGLLLCSDCGSLNAQVICETCKFFSYNSICLKDGEPRDINSKCTYVANSNCEEVSDDEAEI